MLHALAVVLFEICLDLRFSFCAKGWFVEGKEEVLVVVCKDDAEWWGIRIYIYYSVQGGGVVCV